VSNTHAECGSTEREFALKASRSVGEQVNINDLDRTVRVATAGNAIADDTFSFHSNRNRQVFTTTTRHPFSNLRSE